MIKMKGKLSHWLIGSCLWVVMSVAHANIIVPVYKVALTGHGESIGTITLENDNCGVLVTPHLKDLSPGPHGFHIHIKPDCSDNGMAAGGHLDPNKTDAHDGPYNKHGHLGDMPVLIVNQDGTATLPMLAPKFKLADIKGHSIMIHAGSDNYSDIPEKLGGGGARIACGVIPGK
jgi:Cu-Zn family superoxide dismutase